MEAAESTAFGNPLADADDGDVEPPGDAAGVIRCHGMAVCAAGAGGAGAGGGGAERTQRRGGSRLNRLLIEAAFPFEVSPSRGWNCT